MTLVAYHVQPTKRRVSRGSLPQRALGVLYRCCSAHNGAAATKNALLCFLWGIFSEVRHVKASRRAQDSSLQRVSMAGILLSELQRVGDWIPLSSAITFVFLRQLLAVRLQ